MVSATWRATSVSGEKFEKWVYWHPLIFVGVKVRTVWFSARFSLSASVHLIVMRMVLLFFPAMRKFTSVFISTTICICLNKIFGFPLRALLSFVLKGMRFPSEILPIMSIDARISSMRSITIGTPYCFEVKHIEIWWNFFSRIIFIGRRLSFIFFWQRWSELVKQIHSHFIFWMSECTHITIVTRLNFARVALTKLDLIFLRMIEFFNSVMCSGACVTKLAIVIGLGRYHIGANFWCVSS